MATGTGHTSIRSALPPNDVRRLAESHRRSLMAERKSPRTIQSYGEALSQFADYLATTGMPLEIDAIYREHVEAFLVDLLERFKPATAANRYRSLQQFFRWASVEGEIIASLWST